MANAGVVHHSLGHILGFATQRSRGGVEGLRHQLVATPEKKKNTGVNGISLRAKQRTIFPFVEGCVVERIVPRLGSIMVKRDVEETLTVGKERRPAMRGVQSGVKFRNRNRSAPAGAHPHERRCGSWREQDHSTRSPSAAATARCVANYLCRATFNVDRLELTVGKESQGTAVRRPEGESGAAVAGQFASFHRVGETGPECGLAVGAGGRKREVGTVRRKDRRTCRITSQVECCLLRRINDGADRARRLIRAIEEHGSRRQNNRGYQSRSPANALPLV